MALVTCRECDGEVSDQARECPHCGVDFPAAGPEQVSCPECGEPVTEEDAACEACGFPDPASAAHSERLGSSRSTGGSSSSPANADDSWRRTGKVVVENPRNGYRKTLRNPGAKVLFTGCLYFLAHSMWSKAVVGAFVGVATLGIGWLYIGWKAEDYIKDHYRSQGWRVVSG